MFPYENYTLNLKSKSRMNGFSTVKDIYSINSQMGKSSVKHENDKTHAMYETSPHKHGLLNSNLFLKHKLMCFFG